MRLTWIDWRERFGTAAGMLRENADVLSRLDAEIGDGDHGVTIACMAQLIQDAVHDWKGDMSFRSFLENLGWALMNVNGGSTGPLWGTMLGGFAEGTGEGDTDAVQLKSMFRCALAAMDDVTSARLGQKTMMDALIPACKAVEACESNPLHMLRAAASAAEAGAEKTKGYAACFGKAKALREKAIGHRDPGAVSLSILFRGLA